MYLSAVKSRGVVVMLVAAAVLGVAGCSSSSPSADEQTAIYTLVIRELSQEYQPVEGKPLYVVAWTNDGPFSNSAGPTVYGSTAISESVQQGVSDALSAEPFELTWVDSYEDVERDQETGAVVGGGGAILGIGNIIVTDDGVEVAGSSYYGNLGAYGTVYTLEQWDGAWTLTGTTGQYWQS